MTKKTKHPTAPRSPVTPPPGNITAAQITAMVISDIAAAEQRGQTAEQLALERGVSPTYLSRLRHGEIPSRKRLMEWYGVVEVKMYRAVGRGEGFRYFTANDDNL